jgi:hypothetical protein
VVASLLAHALVLLLLAAILVASHARPDRGAEIDAGFPGQLRDDVTSLAPSDRAGDPFTTLDSLDPPSVARERAPEVMKLAEMKDVPLGPTLNVEGAVGSLADSFDAAGPLVLPRLSTPFAGRRAEGRAMLVRRGGGTVESEKAVARGLDWIARHQRPDGGWGLDTAGQCAAPGCPPRPALSSDAAATGLALLPMLGAGHNLGEPGPYGDAVRRGVDWLLAHQKPDGDLSAGAGGNTMMYSHAIAAMALCEAYGLSKQERLREPAQRAVLFIDGAQNAMGGWRYNPGQDGDTSVLGWQMLALRSAHLAGLKVPPRALRGGSYYLDRAKADRFGYEYAYQPGSGASPVMSAEALLIRMYLGWRRSDKRMVKGVEKVAEHLFKSDERNLYYWYYATQLLHNIDDENWKRWNARVRDEVVSTQVQGDGCDRGSWDPAQPRPDRWGSQAGRLFTTALSLLNLEVYYRYLPLYESRDERPMAAAP